ncbi:hypothetical protein M422DRAFT_73885 [Sphaerobolus stellatus SS14]|nr:hypothetical protein M422DRAFT_73885 [Sphaerobolus stellatus SS14]
MYPSEANASTPRLNTTSAFATRQSGSLVGVRAGERASLTASLNADPKFKKYAAQVDKCLQTFDNVQEWADFIAFLTKLLKTFQSFTQFKEIPRKLIVAKRLSQCLNPALPTGVHQRALDVYTHILAVQGTEGLKRDLHLWSVGLFPFFEYAATSVKPAILNLYDIYYLPLQENLRPVMKAFIVALLPGLEEETGEFFDKVLSILDRLSGTVSPAFFLQNIWLVMMITPSARQTSLNFLSRRLPKLNGDEDITPIIGRDVGLMIRAFAAALEDENILVRRAMLDLLEQSFPAESGALKRASKEDRHILMKAASGVVLRRDLSLNRRLFAWLLGPGPEDGQEAYFRAHALELLRATLYEEMVATPGPESRPFKIFISLLDKWEIGSPLVECLLYDAMKAIKRGIIRTDENGDHDLLVTANALYDAVEPLAIWRRLFEGVRRELVSQTPGKEFEAISMVQFVLSRLRAQEEEVQSVHLPVFFSSIVELLKDRLALGQLLATADSLHQALQLLLEMERHIPKIAWQRPIFQEAEKSSIGPYTRACQFYTIVTEDTQGLPDDSSPRSVVPLVTVVEDLVSLNISLSDSFTINAPHTKESLTITLNLLTNLVEHTNGSSSIISWDPLQWLSVVLGTMESCTSFLLLDRVISAVLSMGRAQLDPPLQYDTRKTMLKMMSALMFYLGFDYAPYHARAVQLTWMLEHATTHHHVESIIAQSLNPSKSRNINEAYEAFGVLWRLSEDSFAPGFRFKLPMLMVLDTLRHHDPELRRIGETWMRCSLKSYTRVLEPLLHDLLDPSIRRTSQSSTYDGHEVTGLFYQRPFDQHRMDHLLQALLSFIKIGGQGFSRIARNTQYRKSVYPGFIERIDSARLVSSEGSYVDVLLEILLLYLRSEPQPSLASIMVHANTQIQVSVVDILQTIVARGDLDAPRLQTAEAVVIAKLYKSIHEEQLGLQNKLLHLLHSTLSSLSASIAPHQSRSGPSRISEQDDSPAEKAIPSDDEKRHLSVFVQINPLLLPMLVEGIRKSTGHPGLQHWLDFLLMSVSQFPRILSYTVPPLNECICRQLRLALSDIERIMIQGASAFGSLTSRTTDSEFTMLLNALERLVLLGLSKDYDATLAEKEEDAITERVPPDSGGTSGGLLGMVTNVFGTDGAPVTTEETLSPRSSGYQSLHESVRVLYRLWVLTGQTTGIEGLAEADSLKQIFNRARSRGRKVLERLFRAQSTEVIESIIECWNTATMVTAFTIVDGLTSSSQTVVHMLCESIMHRVSISEKTRRTTVNPHLSDGALFSFLEEYLARLEGPLAVQVWGRFITLAKDITSNLTAYRMQVFPALRCLTVLADKITQTNATEDRRTRKDLQDIYTKLVDNCILIAGRTFDQGTWMRRTAREMAIPANGRASPMPPAGRYVNAYLARHVLPNLRRFLFDNDKVASVCSNAIYYIITPATKSRASRALDFDDYVLDILRELSRIPAGAKAWRPTVVDIYNDNRFFNSTPDASEKWRPVVSALLDSDRQALPEIIGKVASSGSSNIFANKEYENLVRSLNLRRLSYAIFAGDKNQFLTQLPSIQEKLVDILRNPNPSIVEGEVYLCLRVLLCRLSAHNMSSFWPVVLTELLRLFDDVIAEPPADGAESLQVILSASKFIDLVLVLQTEEFQIHQWMFITDTVDAVYRPDNWMPEALLDQLAEIASDLPIPDSKPAGVIDSAANYDGRLDTALTYENEESTPLRRPLLTHIHHIDSIRDLVPFFSHVSIASYEGVYHTNGNVDWRAIEKGLLEEMFEGR